MDFVDHHQTLQRPQRGVRLGQPGKARRVLKVEVVERFGGHELPREGRLAALARAEDGDDTAALERGPDYADVNSAINHATSYTMKVHQSMEDFHGI